MDKRTFVPVFQTFEVRIVLSTNRSSHLRRSIRFIFSLKSFSLVHSFSFRLPFSLPTRRSTKLVKRLEVPRLSPTITAPPSLTGKRGLYRESQKFRKDDSDWQTKRHRWKRFEKRSINKNPVRESRMWISHLCQLMEIVIFKIMVFHERNV